MSEVVFILGAGCSKDSGAPLMNDFLDKARDLYTTKDKYTILKADHFDNVFKAVGALYQAHSKSQLDLINIESVFNTFEMANVLNKLPNFRSKQIPKIIDSIKQLIVTTIESTMYFPYNSNYISAPPPYDHFLALLNHIKNKAFPSRSTSVITFNYDIALDMAYYNYNITPNYGFQTNIRSDSMPLLKLHGSLNWANDIKGKDIIPLTMREYLSKYSIRSWEKTGKCRIPIGTQLKDYFDKNSAIKVRPEPVIVPPTWNKIEHHQAVSKVWSLASKELEDAEFIFIIDYSLPTTDSFFRLLYALGTISDVQLRKIEIFNPDNSDRIRNRFKSLMGTGAIPRYRFWPQDFNSAISHIRNYFPSKS